MDDSRHFGQYLSYDQMHQLQLFAEIYEWRRGKPSSSAGPASVAELTGRDPTINEKYPEREIKRQRQGLRVDETSSPEQLDVSVYNLRNLARQTVQHKAEPRMLRVLMNLILVEGSSLAINQWDDKLRAREWVLPPAIIRS